MVESIQGTSHEIVLAGPPGTDKMFVARHLPAYLLGRSG
ncbi:hypothetical protein SAMN04489806_2308 [Paramicrobacterium humi]|uniref:Uncharacterized protein n=1 Tax=Paramicrobacterium humi TaxID=640635 RepID=A0A1H4NVF5_9MICO|nr:hypothetical protein SAMN04489806_2308 [Microbacterium humi]